MSDLREHFVKIINKMSAAFGYISLIFVVSVQNVYGALGTNCTSGGDADCVAGNNEICSTDGSLVCICDDGSSYAPGPVQTTLCFLAIALNSPCNDNDECLLGNGGSHSTCSTNCICDTGYAENAGTCEKATDLNNACSGDPECELGNGGANSGCSTNCVCDGGYLENGGTCAKATDLNNACSGNPECTLGNGGAGAVCSTNCVCDAGNAYTEDSSTCKKDCGNPTASAGYVPEATPSSTLQAATATVQCASGYTGTAATITCEASGS